jgi:hypothetical protein
MSKTLFIVISPFQALCALEAINHFKIQSYDFLIPYSDTYGLNNIENLLNMKGIPFTIKYAPHIIRDVIPLIFTQHSYYKSIFIGYYYSLTLYAFASIYASFRAKICYLDDGAQTLEIFSDPFAKRCKNIRQKMILSLYKLLFALKCTSKFSFFTIYDVVSNRFNIIRNDLSLLRSGIMSEQKGIYIIGTNSSILEFKDHSYTDLITQLHKYLIHHYPLSTVYYCQHRRDTNSELNNSLCNKLGIEIFNTEISVEYDFPYKKINPILVIGFTSNALFTLKKIFPRTIIESVNFKLKSNSLNDSNQLIQQVFYQNGIAIVNIFE